MKLLTLVLFMMLTSSAFSATSLEKQLHCTPQETMVRLENGTNEISCSIQPLKNDDHTPNRVFNIMITFNPLEGIEVSEGERVRVIPYVGKEAAVAASWNVNAAEGEYYLKDAFGVSWDDNVSIELIGLNTTEIETPSQVLKLAFTVKTEDTSFCDEMYSKGVRPDKTIGADWAGFWMNKSNCNTLVRIVVNNKETYESLADTNGTVPVDMDIELYEGTNKVQIYAEDPSGNIAMKRIIVTYTPDPLAGMGWIIMMVRAAIVFIVIAVVIAFFLTKMRTMDILKKAFEKEEKKDSKNRLGELKAKQKKLGHSLEELRTKSVNVGLSEGEESRKRAYENELVRITDELFKNLEYMNGLKQRAAKALSDARSGLSSVGIKKQLIKEGYSNKEIEQIKRFFHELKEAEKTQLS